MDVVAYGPHALLLRFAERADEAALLRGRALVAELERHPPRGLREIVPAFTTLLLDFEPGTKPPIDWWREAPAERVGFPEAADTGSAGASRQPKRIIEIPVHYAGPDLARVAEHAGLSVEEVIARHIGAEYRVHCLGFAPAFPYLGGLDPRLHTPRLATPRPRVPAGSVAIGGEHTGIYSIPSPGGWNLIGTTDTTLFNPHAASVDEMFLLKAGDRVRFVRTRIAERGLRKEEAVRAETVPRSEFPAPRFLHVLSPGLGLTLQDLGRPGFARFGVPPGGAMDPHSAAWANRLLDNPPSAPVLELCLQGQRLAVLRDGWLALTGSASGLVAWSAFRVRAGETLEFPPAPAGVWRYLATPGGFAGERLLGSVSTNVRAGLGRPAQAGDEFAAACDTAFALPSQIATRTVAWGERRDFARPPVLRVWPGPQWDWFSAADRERFFATAWTVSSQSDRVGYRLQGPALTPSRADLISEPVLAGSIQIPANGQPIVTMPDGPTLGGYPKLGLVDPDDLPWLAQIRPGKTVRFCPMN